jgi:hypothetical protein
MVMTAAYRLLLDAFAERRVGMSVRDIRVGGRSLHDVHKLLTHAGFVLTAGALFADRTPDGKPQYWCVGETRTTRRDDPQIVPLDVYVHADGGMVRVFPVGDPRGRVVPRGRISALKSVVFKRPDPTTRTVDTSFANEAFRVSDEGDPVPKGRRAIHGLRFDPEDKLASYRLAQTVHAHLAVIFLEGTST